MERQKYPGLQIEEDVRQQELEWRVQRIAWPLLYLLLVAIGLGIFGSGPLATVAASAGDGSLQLEYQRFMRYRSPDTLHLKATPEGSSISALISNEYAEAIDIQQISPQPEHVIALADAVRFVFNTGGREAVDIQFDIQPERHGTLRGWIALDGHARTSVRQFVFP